MSIGASSEETDRWTSPKGSAEHSSPDPRAGEVWSAEPDWASAHTS
jgi:hypothetical protein